MSYQDFPPQRAPPGPTPYALTREEKRVLQECNSESFYRRCVPFMTVLGLGAYYGVHLGYLKKNINYGAGPKVTVGLVVGFIAGKLSYQEACEEKILRLPGGKLKESVLLNRSRRDGGWKPLDDGGVYKDASISYALPPYAERSFSSYQQPNRTSEIDVERPMDNFDDSFRIRSEFADEEQALPHVSPSASVSYDELRSRNREEYETRRRQFRPGSVDDYPPFTGSYTPPPPPPKSEFDDRPAADGFAQYGSNEFPYAPAQNRAPPQRRNFYGDVIEK